MPTLSNKCTVCQECVPTSKLHRKEAREGYLPAYWPRNRGRWKTRVGVLLGGLQTVYINSMWESIIKMSLKNNALYSILYSSAKNVSECWGMYVWVCPKCDCNCVWDPLMWPSAWGLTLLSNIHSLSLTVSPTFTLLHSDYLILLHLVCAPLNSRTKNTARYQTTRNLKISKHKTSHI